VNLGDRGPDVGGVLFPAARGPSSAKATLPGLQAAALLGP